MQTKNTYAGLVLFFLAILSPVTFSSAVIFNSAMASPPPLSFAAIDSLWQSGQQAAAIEQLQRRDELARADGDSVSLLNALFQLGKIHTALGRPKPAMPLLAEARQLALAIPDSNQLLGVHRWYGVALGQAGDNARAKIEFEDLLIESRLQKDPEHEGWALIGLAYQDEIAVRMEAARRRYAGAAALHRANGNGGGELFALNGLGRALNKLGSFDEAVDVFSRVSVVAREIGRPYLAGLAENSMGGLLLDLGAPAEAQQHLQLSAELLTREEAGSMWIYPRLNLARAEASLGHFTDSLARLDALWQEIELVGNPALLASILYSQAEVLILQGKSGHAGVKLREVLATEGVSISTEYESLWVLGMILLRQGKAAEAVTLLEERASLVRTMTDAGLQVSYDVALTSALIEVGKWEQASQTAQHGVAKCREHGLNLELLDLLAMSARIAEYLDQPDSAITYLEEAVQVWNELRSVPRDYQWRERIGSVTHSASVDLARLYLAHGNEAGKRDDFDRALAVAQKLKALTLLERMQGPGALTSGSFVGPTSFDLETLQNKTLGEGEILLDFLLGRSGSLLFAISRDDFRVIELPAAAQLRGSIDLLLELVLAPMNNGATARPGVSATAIEAGSAALAAELLGPIADMLRQATSVVVIPDRALHRLPLTLLMHHVTDEVPKVYRIPAAVMLANPGQPDVTETADLVSGLQGLVVSGANSGGGRADFGELDYLKANYRGISTKIGVVADSVGVALAQYDLLHFAAHSSVNREYPWRSAIHLPDAITDSLVYDLEAQEIVGLDLKARIAVLASCESAGGRVLAAEGVLGLGSAFLGAGVKTVVAALWPVDDAATTSLMIHFYDCLASGCSVSESLGFAQQEIASQPATSHPYFWAGFVVLGQGDISYPLVRQGSWWEKQPVILVLCIVLPVLIWRYRGTQKKQ